MGIGALKRFLGGLLFDHINDEFPDVVKDIETLSEEAHRELELLGPSRQTSNDQRRFLTRIATKYQTAVSAALTGNYDADLAGDSPLKLRMHIRDLNDNFSARMASHGHVRIFFTVQGEIDKEFARKKNDKENVLDWIRSTYRESRGAELPGTVNPAVLENLFRQQTEPWPRIARSYVEQIIRVVAEFNKTVLQDLVVDDDLRQKLDGKLAQNCISSADRATTQLSVISKDERGGILQTVNHYFADTLSAIREERVLTRLRNAQLYDGVAFDTKTVMQSIHLSNEDQAVLDIHDILKAYYKVAIKRFTDNVIMQVTERIVLGVEGPVKLFSPEMTGGLGEEELMRIAGESFVTANARLELVARCDRYQRALDIAREATS